MHPCQLRRGTTDGKDDHGYHHTHPARECAVETPWATEVDDWAGMKHDPENAHQVFQELVVVVV
jgi:hypothetical protein